MLTALAALVLTAQPTPATPTPHQPVAVTAVNLATFASTLKGTWSGTIDAPGGRTLTFILDIQSPTDATIAIPQQGLKPTPLTNVTITAQGMLFALKHPGIPDSATPTFALALDSPNGPAKGTMTQSGIVMPAAAAKLPHGQSAAAPARPQTPKPPFPYTTTDITLTGHDGAHFAGTLTTPPPTPTSKPPFPCALFISGSGTQDRDETLFDHKPFAVIADALARAGIASLRIDDRGWNNAHNPQGNRATTATFTQDTISALTFLATAPSIDPNRLGLIGHSEGALIAPAAAAQHAHLRFAVLLNGPGVPGDQVLALQLQRILAAQGFPHDKLEPLLIAQRAALVAAKEADDRMLRAAAAEALRLQHAATGLPEPTLPEIDQAVATFSSPWMRHFLARDPRPDLAAVPHSTHLLIIAGGKDVQVDAAQNVPAMLHALLAAGHTSITTRIYPRANHLLQSVGPTGSGAPDQYATIEQTIDPQILEHIVTWTRDVTR